MTGVRLAHITTVDLSLRFLLSAQLQSFRKAGFDTVGISAPGPWVAELEQMGIPHIAVPALKRRWAPLSDLQAFLSLVAALRRLRPTIVHTHTPKAGVLGRLAARITRVPIVINTVHGFYPAGESSVQRRILLLGERLAARLSDFEFCQSREDLVTLRDLGFFAAGRSAYLGNGVNLDVFDPARVDREAVRVGLGIPRAAIVVGTVGRLVWEKGYQEFFHVAEALKRDAPGTILVAIGPHDAGKDDAVPQQVIDELERRGTVRFLGMRTDMPELYAAMDIFVLPSYREGFPRSAIEAAAMGRPLVLTDIRGCREVVDDGRNGFLVPPRDAASLLDRVRRLARDPELRARFGRESRARALAEFDEQRIIVTTLEVYRRLLAEHHDLRIGSHQESTAGG